MTHTPRSPAHSSVADVLDAGYEQASDEGDLREASWRCGDRGQGSRLRPHPGPHANLTPHTTFCWSAILCELSGLVVGDALLHFRSLDRLRARACCSCALTRTRTLPLSQRQLLSHTHSLSAFSFCVLFAFSLARAQQTHLPLPPNTTTHTHTGLRAPPLCRSSSLLRRTSLPPPPHNPTSVAAHPPREALHRSSPLSLAASFIDVDNA